MVTPLSTVCHHILTAEKTFNRCSGSVSLLVVSKTRTTDDILAVAAQGQHHFGENYVNEALSKIKFLADHPLVWHFIGTIQSNKTADIAQYFSWVHGVDRIKIAQHLNRHRPEAMPPLNVCININISQEKTKSGVSLEALPALAQCIAEQPRLRLRGLMCLPVPEPDFEKQRRPFKQLAATLRVLQDQGFDVDTLSMGTTADYPAAIAEGATIVRLGTAVFGERHSHTS